MASVITSNTGSGLALQPDASGQLQFSTGYGGTQLTLANNVLTMGSNVSMTMGDGTQYVTASSFGMRNRLINGSMQIWQRATTYNSTPTGGAYVSVDRWCANSTSPMQFNRSTSVPTGYQYSLQIQRPSGATSTVTIWGFQTIESVNMIDLAGQPVIFSFWAKAGANFSGNGGATAWVISGTVADQGYSTALGSWTGSTNVIQTGFNPTTTWTRYTFSGTVPSNSLELAVAVSFGPTGTAGADDSLYITGAQFEIGTVATPFERRIYTQELANCQRYYQTFGSSDVPLSGYTDQVTITYVFPVQMRVTPGLTHPYTDGTYDSAGPAAGKWSFNRAYVTNIAKSAGTITSQTQIQNAWAQIYLYGMTLASVPTGINSNTQANITFSAEL